jgi:hypothetical protein
VIQKECSVYNVHVCKKREQEAMKVGIEFGSTPLSQTRRSSVIKSRLHPYHKMELLIPNRSVEAHRAFLVLAFSREGKTDTSSDCQSCSETVQVKYFLADD